MSDPAAPGLCVRQATELEALQLTVDLRRHPELRAPLEDALDAPLPEPGVPGGDESTILWLGPSDYLLTASRAWVSARLGAIQTAVDGRAALLDVPGGGWVGLDLVGEASLDICRRPAALKPQGRASAVTRLAGLRVAMLFPSEAEADAMVRLFVEPSDVDYICSWLAWRGGRI